MCHCATLQTQTSRHKQSVSTDDDALPQSLLRKAGSIDTIMRHNNRPKRPSPSTRSGTVDKQESLSKSKEFKQWSSQQKLQSLRKAKSSKSVYDSDQSDRGQSRSRHHSKRPQPPSHHHTPYHHGIVQEEYTRKQSQQSQSSAASQSELNLNTVSSSSERVSSEDLNFIKENTASFYPQTHGTHGVSPYGDYMSPSPKQPPTQLTKMWTQTLPNGAYIGNLSNKSSSTNNSGSSMKGMAMHRMERNNGNISSVHFEILKHLELGIQTVENQVPRELMKVMNEGMVKITLEFCGFDIENEAKFNPLYTQLEQLLKIQNVKTMYVLHTVSFSLIPCSIPDDHKHSLFLCRSPSCSLSLCLCLWASSAILRLLRCHFVRC